MLEISTAAQRDRYIAAGMPIVLFKPGCAYCDQFLRFVQHTKFGSEAVKLSTDSPAGRRWSASMGVEYVPSVYKNGRVYTGNDIYTKTVLDVSH